MNKNKISLFISFVRSLYGEGNIPLHRPVFRGNEKKYLADCIDSNFVSSIGQDVIRFEQNIKDFTGSKYAIATTNGTSALHIALKLAGVEKNSEVITQALNFVASCNAISYCGAHPVFVDVDLDSMGMAPFSLQSFLNKYCELRNGCAWNKITGRKIAACLPMHTFGFPCRINQISSICQEWGIVLVEDAAESLGSYLNKKHTGTYGKLGILSFNGNKIITTGGGGMILTNEENIAVHAKHITTTSKKIHPYEFDHNEIGYNYRLPNINAALGCAQFESLPNFLSEKIEIFERYESFFESIDIELAKPIAGTQSNHWLNTILLKSKAERDFFLDETNNKGIMTRPVWKLMSRLLMFKNCQNDGLYNSIWLEDRAVNIPSSVQDF